MLLGADLREVDEVRKKTTTGPRFTLPGFDSGVPDQGTRGIYSLYGTSGTGKSTLGMLFPAFRKVVFDIDFGTQRVPTTLAKRLVCNTVRKRYTVVTPKPPASLKMKTRPKTPAEKAEEEAWYAAEAERISKDVLATFREDWETALESEADCLVIDKASELWAMCRAAFAGRILSVPQVAYGEINALYRGFVRSAANAGKALILIHNMKALWEETFNEKGEKVSRDTGRLAPSWFKETEDLSDVVLRCYRELPVDEKGRVQVAKKTYQVAIDKGGPAVGLTLDLTDDEGYKLTAWQDIASLVFPDSDPGLWEMP